MSNNWNNNRDFHMTNMNMYSVMLNKTGLEFSSIEHQKKSSFKIAKLLSKNRQDHIKGRNFNTEFETKIFVPIDEMLSNGNELLEMSRQLSVTRKICHDSVQEYEIEYMPCPVTVKENKPNQQLNFSKMPSVEMTQDSTFTGCINTDENEVNFGNKIYYGHQKQFANAECSNLVQPPCFSGATASNIGLSYSLDSKRFSHICKREFCSKFYLKQHLKVHSGIKPFICNICQRRFTYKSNLKEHAFVHTLEKSYKCEICGNVFARKYNLVNHMLIHRCGNSHRWEICGRSFTKRCDLMDHVKSQHGLLNLKNLILST